MTQPKNANYGDDIDRISELPDNAIDCIIEGLNVRDLVRTSILSRKWRYMWVSVPRLEFREDFVGRCKDFNNPGHMASRIITEVLLLHNAPINKFILQLPFNFKIVYEHLNKWILVVSRNHVKYIELVNHVNSMDLVDIVNHGVRPILNRIPYHLFSCQELTYLKLSGFNLTIPLNFTGFKSLLHLHLESITFEFDALHSLVSGCPLLEKLCILNYSGCECFNFSAPALKVLNIDSHNAVKSICLEKTTNIIDLTLLIFRENESCLINSFPKVQRLTLGLGYKMPYADIIPLTQLTNLRFLDIFDMNLNKREELLYLVRVLKSASNLVELVLQSCYYYNEEPDLAEELECNGCCLSQLKTVKIKVGTSFKNEMSLIRFILANSPSLKTLTFDIGFGFEASDAPMLLSLSQDLLWMERASERARIKIIHLK
ncbi:F-box/FBD/LRR-repeat protein At1g13570-like [Vicia villosa]|uniref:F-box/FBD/LRR-repeat protein At1g13570-like n=1 Tax=Vicia villosa TaxID=3911 RepID=UPI00273BE448|nr:F-box/FBD/LRR-repeat protein At1g13570-like [Vicia villosa]